MTQTAKKPVEQLRDWGIQFEGEWDVKEIQRVLNIFQSLIKLADAQSVLEIFNQQPTILHHSNRPGKVGRTRNCDIFLDEHWTDWTLAHELGHRWNNAWNRHPEAFLRRAVSAGRWEGIKHVLRRVEKRLGEIFKKLGVKSKFDWKALWYHTGEAPPPCGVDRNFNASEDLAESFASVIFPEDAKIRASNAAKRLAMKMNNWDWGSRFNHFEETPRGVIIRSILNGLSTTKEQAAHQPNQGTAQNQPDSTDLKLQQG